ncbi:hypothetical protein TQ38_002220 [Novosphingobium sp. P6W]|nr:hypothetical protein TQ38_002220 [Novosphingobium sp. P6W]KIS32502.1 hypothetical protein TQ38_09190 [Novosphingobium sp. P6W]
MEISVQFFLRFLRLQKEHTMLGPKMIFGLTFKKNILMLNLVEGLVAEVLLKVAQTHLQAT